MQKFLLLFLIFSQAILFSKPTKEEAQAFQEVERALEDGLFDLTVQRGESFQKKFTASELKGEVRWLLAKSYYYLGQFEAASNESKAPFRQVSEKYRLDYLLFQAEVASLREDWVLAETRYREFIAEYPKAKQLSQAQLGLGLSLLRQNKEDEAKSILTNLSQNKSGEITGQRAALYWALGSMMRGQWKESINQLELLRQGKLKPEILYEVFYWLGETHAELKQWKEAQLAYQKVTQDSKAFPKDLVAKSWLGLGRVFQELKEGDKAQSAFEKAYTLSDQEALKRGAFRGFLEVARIQKKLPEAVEKLKEYVAQNQEKSNSSTALFAIAQAYADNQEELKAISTFEALLLAYPKAPSRFLVYLELGKLYPLDQKSDLALDAYRKVIDGSTSSKLKAQAYFEIAQIQVSLKNEEEAMKSYEKAMAEDASLSERALFNLIFLSSQQGNLSKFSQYEERFLKQYPQSSFKDRIGLEKVALLQKSGSMDEAKKALEILLQSPKGGNTLLLQLKYADLLYQSEKFEEAWQLYDKMLTQSSDDPLLPEIAYKNLFAGLATKKMTQDQVIQGLLALIKKYPKHSKTPHFLLSLGEFYFQAQDFGSSQTYFDQLVKDFPSSELVDDAQYWSGRSAVGRSDFASAIAILEKISENSSLKIESRLLQGKIYLRQLKYDKAVQLFDAVIEQDKQGRVVVEAILRKGDAYLGWGANDNSKYELALNSFQQAMQQKGALLSQWNEATFKKSKALQKLNRTDEALASYMDLLNGRGSESTEKQVPEYLWRIKGGLEAADMKQSRKDWKGALAVYRKLEQLGGPNQQEFRDAIHRIKRENFIYEDEG